MQKFKLINSQFIRRFLLLMSENDRTILYYTQQFHTLVNIKREDVSTYTYTRALPNEDILVPSILYGQYFIHYLTIYIYIHNTSPLGLCPMMTSLYPQYYTDSITYIT